MKAIDEASELKDKQIMAEVLVFPLARRHGYIQRQAAIIAGIQMEAGERYLKYQLIVQHQSLERRGIACDVIAREVVSLGHAIRAEVWRSILTLDCLER